MEDIKIGGVSVGDASPIRINCNIGCNTQEDLSEELHKIQQIKDSGMIPDFMMDLSLIRLQRPLYKDINEILGIPVGTVLSYIPFNKRAGLEWICVKEYFLQICQEGIAFLTIHFTADLDLYDQARKARLVPCTSRGGAFVLFDSLINNRKINIFREHIDEIAQIALKYNVVVSLGTTFRPSNIFDACDAVQIEELSRQIEICRYLQTKGVSVLVENSGHISLANLQNYANRLKGLNAPIMPLGPMICDNAVNEDHIVAALGEAFSGYWKTAHILNCVTRYEHSQAAITTEVILEAIRTARIVAHCLNLARGMEDDWKQERNIDEIRAREKSCIIGTHCNRCKNVCPLKLV